MNVYATKMQVHKSKKSSLPQIGFHFIVKHLGGSPHAWPAECGHQMSLHLTSDCIYCNCSLNRIRYSQDIIHASEYMFYQDIWQQIQTQTHIIIKRQMHCIQSQVSFYRTISVACVNYQVSCENRLQLGMEIFTSWIS